VLPSPKEIGFPAALVPEKPASNSEKLAVLVLKAVVFMLERLSPTTFKAKLALFIPVKAV
jgi:hypothetical protein